MDQRERMEQPPVTEVIGPSVGNNIGLDRLEFAPPPVKFYMIQITPGEDITCSEFSSVKEMVTDLKILALRNDDTRVILFRGNQLYITEGRFPHLVGGSFPMLPVPLFDIPDPTKQNIDQDGYITGEPRLGPTRPDKITSDPDNRSKPSW